MPILDKISTIRSLLRTSIQSEYLYFYLSSILSTAPGFLILFSKGFAFYGEIAVATASLTFFAAFTQFRSYDVLNHVVKPLTSFDEKILIVELLPYQIIQAVNLIILIFSSLLICKYSNVSSFYFLALGNNKYDFLSLISIVFLFVVSSFNGYFVSVARLLKRNNQILLSYKLASLVCVLCVLFSAYFKNLSVLNSCLLIFLAQYSVAMSSCIIGASYSLDVLRRVYVHKENRKFSIPLSISFSFYRKIQSTLFSGFLLSINKTLESPLELFAFRLLTDQYLLGVYKLMRQLLGFMLIYETIKYQKILTRSVSSSVKSVRVACLQIMPKLEISLFLIFISFPLFICAILGSSMKERLLQSSADLSLFIVIYSAIIVSAINMKSITPFALLASAGRYVQLTFAFAVLFIFLILSIIFSFYAILPPIPLIFFMQYGYLARLILYNRLNLKYI